MDKSRANRKHHEQRVKAKAAKRIKGQVFSTPEEATNPKRIGRLAKTPKPCSCFMCGNYRKNGLEPFKELVDYVKLKEGLTEY